MARMLYRMKFTYVALVLIAIAVYSFVECKDERSKEERFVGDYVRNTLDKWRAPVASVLQSMSNAVLA